MLILLVKFPYEWWKAYEKYKLNLANFYIKCNYDGFIMFSISILLWPNMAPPSSCIWTYDFVTTLVLGLWSKFGEIQIKIDQELSQNMGGNKTHFHN